MSNDFTEMAQKIRRLPRLIKRFVTMNVDDVFEKMARDAQRNVYRNDSVATNTLAGSIESMDGPSNVTQRARGGYETHVVRADAPYAAFVEYGTGLRQRGRPSPGGNFDSPSAPPVTPILEWMVEKGITSRTQSDVLPDRVAAAQAIAESIARFGQRPHPYMRPAFAENRMNISRAHRDGVRKALRSL